MRTPGTVEVELWSEQVGDVQAGQWCETCALPSALSVEVVIGTGTTVLSRSTMIQCQDCKTWTQVALPTGEPEDA